MNKCITLLAALLLSVSMAHGTQWNIHPDSTYKTIVAGHTAANANDTLLLGTATFRERPVLSKNLVIIGNGVDSTFFYCAEEYEFSDFELVDYGKAVTDIYRVSHAATDSLDGLWIDDTWIMLSDSSTMIANDESAYYKATGDDSLYVHFATPFDECVAPKAEIYSLYCTANLELRNMTIGYASDLVLYLNGSSTNTYKIDSCAFDHGGFSSGYIGNNTGSDDDTLYVSNSTFASFDTGTNNNEVWNCRNASIFIDNITLNIGITGTSSVGLYLSNSAIDTISLTNSTVTVTSDFSAFAIGGGAIGVFVDSTNFVLSGGGNGLYFTSTYEGDALVEACDFKATGGTCIGIISAHSDVTPFPIDIDNCVFTKTGAFDGASDAISLAGPHTNADLTNLTILGDWSRGMNLWELTGGSTVSGCSLVCTGVNGKEHGILIGGEGDADPAYSCDSVFVFENYIKNHTYGLLLEYDADSSWVFNNHIEDCTNAIYVLHDCNHDTIFNNEIVNCTNGIRIPNEEPIVGWTHADSCFAIYASHNTFINVTNDTLSYYEHIVYPNELIDTYDTDSRDWIYYWGGEYIGRRADGKLTLLYNWIQRGRTQGTTFPEIGLDFDRLADSDSLVELFSAWEYDDIVVYPMDQTMPAMAHRKYEILSYIKNGTDTLFVATTQEKAALKHH